MSLMNSMKNLISESSKSKTQDSSSSNILDEIAEDKKIKALATFVIDSFNKCKSDRLDYERQWYLNIAFYRGNQWVGYVNKKDLVLASPSAPKWRPRLTVNRIRPVVRTELARLTSQKPNASITPASSEDEDLFAAQAGEQVWQSYYTNNKINTLFGRTAFWCIITGVGFLKTYWDPDATDNHFMIQEENGELAPAMGEIVTEPVTPFHIFVPDLMEPELERQQYVIHAKFVPLVTAKELYPEYAKEMEANVSRVADILDTTKLRPGSSDSKPDSVMMLEMWLKPGAHKDAPNGGRILVVGSKVVDYDLDGLPYKHGQFPFQKLDYIPTGMFYSDSVVSDIISLQREYNRTRSQIIESKNLMSKPQLVAAKGSVNPSKITSEPGLVIEFMPGMPAPAPLPIQGIPSYVLQELDRIIIDIEDITAQHQVSKGSTPTGVTAATAINYLQEKDDSLLSHTYQSSDDLHEKLARQVLSLIVQYWTVDRIVKVTGSDGAFDSMLLKNTDLIRATDIRVEAGSSLPTSKAARQAFIMDMMSRGFIPPDQGLRIMEIGGMDSLYKQLQVDERQAQRENIRMKQIDPAYMEEFFARSALLQSIQAQQMQLQQLNSTVPPELSGPDGFNVQETSPEMGQPGIPSDPSTVDPSTGQPLAPVLPVSVNTWDNHAVHIDVHNRFRKTQAFEVLPEPVKQLFEEHVKAHAAALNQSANFAQMTGGMGVPPMSQSEGGQMPPTSQGDVPNG